MNPASFDIIDGIPHYKLFIDGQWVSSSRNRLADDINPATGKVFARTQQAGAEEVNRAIEAAHRAARSWGATLVSEREIFVAAYRGGDPTAHGGDPRPAHRGVRFGLLKGLVGDRICRRRAAAAAGDARHVMGETMPMTMPGQLSISIRKPLGVIAGIAPFNSPFLLSMKKIVYAFATGNTFILKPSEETPVSGALIADLFQEAGLPPGVLNVVPGIPAEVGDLLIADPRVKMITFTGSTRTGRHLASEAAKHLKKFTLEMGGKSPLIVLKDADLDYAVDAAAFGIFLHQGQVCMANSKVIVEAPLFNDFIERFKAKTATIKVGDPRDPQTVIGSLIRAHQCDFVDGQLKDATEKGAKVVLGGTHEGQFYHPTVLTGVTPDMRIYHEESFGPVVSLIRADDSEDALRIANDTEYGLAAAVITNDMQKALDLSMRLESGMVHVNDTTISDEPHVPFGGTKNSGFGREGGRYSLEELTEVKWVTMQMGKRAFPF
jgi:vanillin dehydrogenase